MELEKLLKMLSSFAKTNLFGYQGVNSFNIGQDRARIMFSPTSLIQRFIFSRKEDCTIITHSLDLVRTCKEHTIKTAKTTQNLKL